MGLMIYDKTNQDRPLFSYWKSLISLFRDKKYQDLELYRNRHFSRNQHHSRIEEFSDRYLLAIN